MLEGNIGECVLVCLFVLYWVLVCVYLWKIEPNLYKKDWFWKYRAKRKKILKKLGLYKEKRKVLYYE